MAVCEEMKNNCATNYDNYRGKYKLLTGAAQKIAQPISGNVQKRNSRELTEIQPGSRCEIAKIAKRIE